MGAMVGMAVADSVGAFLEFLPVGKKARWDGDSLRIDPCQLRWGGHGINLRIN